MYPPSHVPAPARPMSVGRILAIAVGVALGLLLMAAIAAGGGGSAESGSAGYDGSDYGSEQSGGGSQPSTQFYEGGTLTSDGNGGIIVSGTDGSSFSTS